MTDRDLTSSDIAEQVTHLLASSGARQISRRLLEGWPETAVAYEDEYSIIGVFQFENFDALEDGWLDAQDLMIQLVSNNVTATDSKAWDGYLVLCTAGAVSIGKALALNYIRLDTRRVRKLVITANDLLKGEVAAVALVASLRALLSPLLQLQVPGPVVRPDPLLSIGDRVALSEEMASDLAIAIAAHDVGVPMVETISKSDGQMHDSRSESGA